MTAQDKLAQAKCLRNDIIDSINAFYGSDSQSDSYKEEIAAALAGAAALEREATPALPDEERYYQLVNENRRLEEENARLRLPSPAPDVSEAELASILARAKAVEMTRYGLSSDCKKVEIVCGGILVEVEYDDCDREKADQVVNVICSNYDNTERLIAALRAARKREGEAVDLLCEMRRHVPTFCDDDASDAKQKMNAFLAAREAAALNEGAKNG